MAIQPSEQCCPSALQAGNLAVDMPEQEYHIINLEEHQEISSNIGQLVLHQCNTAVFNQKTSHRVSWDINHDPMDGLSTASHMTERSIKIATNLQRRK